MTKLPRDTTLLIVENDDVFREQLSKVMSSRGFDPIPAGTVAEAAAAIDATQAPWLPPQSPTRSGRMSPCS